MVKRGTFIVFEGLDRCGKTTQVARLEASLRDKGHPVRTQKFPGKPHFNHSSRAQTRAHSRGCCCSARLDRTTEIGKMIDAYLRNATEMDDRAIHLLFSANRWECA